MSNSTSSSALRTISTAVAEKDPRQATAQPAETFNLVAVTMIRRSLSQTCVEDIAKDNLDNSSPDNAHIKSMKNSTLDIVYDDNPQLEFHVTKDSVRLPPPKSSCKGTVGDEVEAYSRTSEGEPFGWWLAQIRMVVGEWCLIEYAAGGQEFVLPASMRPKNGNRLGSVETLWWSHWAEERRVSRQEREKCPPEKKREEQPCQAQVDARASQPTGRTVHQERVQASGSGKITEENDACTEESWESEAVCPAWHLNIEPPPPKASKSARRRQNRQKAVITYTLEDEYDKEEVRKTPQGMKLFRLFGSRWVQMG